MVIEEINIRDPFVLPFNGKYYMYGTRAESCWSVGDGFDVYISDNLSQWEGPIEVFHRPEGFWGNKNFWAPEVYRHNDSFLMAATFSSSESGKKGTMLLSSDSPLGPFRLYSHDILTPLSWMSLDGTLLFSPHPYMIFAHEWQDVENGDGEICIVRLSDDLKECISAPKLLFKASEAKPWVKGIEHKRYPGLNYVTDGPFAFHLPSGRILLLWSSFSENGYTEAYAISQSSDPEGEWTIGKDLIYDKNGGHGMIFKHNDGHHMLVLHTPNTHLEERPLFIDVDEILARIDS